MKKINKLLVLIGFGFLFIGCNNSHAEHGIDKSEAGNVSIICPFADSIVYKVDMLDNGYVADFIQTKKAYVGDSLFGNYNEALKDAIIYGRSQKIEPCTRYFITLNEDGKKICFFNEGTEEGLKEDSRLCV